MRLPGVTIFSWLLAVATAAIYARSALHKLRNPFAFREIVRQYEILPLGTVDWFAPAVSVLEVLTAIWLLVPWTRGIGAVLGATLQVFFLTAILMRMGRHLPRGCGCHRLHFPERISWEHAGRNFALFLVFTILGGMESWN